VLILLNHNILGYTLLYVYNLFYLLIRVPLVEQELFNLPEHLSSPPVFGGVRVTRSLVLCVCFVDRCLSFCPFSFAHCVVGSSSIYRFWLPLWDLQTLLTEHDVEKSVTIDPMHTHCTWYEFYQIRIKRTKWDDFICEYVVNR